MLPFLVTQQSQKNEDSKIVSTSSPANVVTHEIPTSPSSNSDSDTSLHLHAIPASVVAIFLFATISSIICLVLIFHCLLPGFNEWRLRRNLKKRLAVLLNNNKNFPVFEFKGEEEQGEEPIPSSVTSNSYPIPVSTNSISTPCSSSSSLSSLSFEIVPPQRSGPSYPSLPSSLPSCSSTKITCSICLEDYQSGDPIRELPCRHDFHIMCIQPWLERAILENSVICPVCRSVWDIPSSPTPCRFLFRPFKNLFHRIASFFTVRHTTRRAPSSSSPPPPTSSSNTIARPFSSTSTSASLFSYSIPLSSLPTSDTLVSSNNSMNHLRFSSMTLSSNCSPSTITQSASFTPDTCSNSTTPVRSNSESETVIKASLPSPLVAA